MKRTVICMAALPFVLATADAAQLEGTGKKLRLMHIQMQATGKAVDAAVARFREATGAEVIVEAFKNDAFKQKIAVELASASPPDVFHTWGGGGLADYVRKGLVLPLPENLADGISPRALDFCRVDAKLFALPADLSIVGFWFRRSIFENLNISPPTTFGELCHACTRIRKAGRIPIALGNLEHWPGAFYTDYFVLRLGGASEYLTASNEEGKPAATTSALTAAELTRTLVRLDAFPQGFQGLDYDQSRAIFLRGDAAMTLMGSWLLSYAISEKPELVRDIGLFAFPPLTAGPDAGTLLGGTNAAYAVFAKTSNPELALKLVTFLTDGAAAKDWAEANRLPARKTDLPEAVPALEDAWRLLDAAPRIQLYYDQALEPAVAEKHKAWTQSIFATTRPNSWMMPLVGVVAIFVLLVMAVALSRVFRNRR